MKINFIKQLSSNLTASSVHTSLSDNELAVFAEQLSLLLHSGISLLEGISILLEDFPEGPEKQYLTPVLEQLELTGELSSALSSTGQWPDYFIKMTELGERSGTLDDVMHSLSVYYTRRSILHKNIKSAVIYPLILLSMLSAVLFVLMDQVMPVFYQVFRQLGIEISGITASVFYISRISQTIAAVLLLLVITCVIFCMLLLRTETGRKHLLSVLQYIPLIRQIRHLLSCSRFSGAMSAAIHSGLDMSESFDLASSLTEDTVFQQKLESASVLLEEGTEFGEAFNKTGVFTGMNARLFSVGFRSGSADTVLEQISISCQEESEHRIQSAVGLLEPVLTVILSILTGLILVSVMLPLLSVMSSIG